MEFTRTVFALSDGRQAGEVFILCHLLLISLPRRASLAGTRRHGRRRSLGPRRSGASWRRAAVEGAGPSPAAGGARRLNWRGAEPRLRAQHGRGLHPPRPSRRRPREATVRSPMAGRPRATHGRRSAFIRTASTYCGVPIAAWWSRPGPVRRGGGCARRRRGWRSASGSAPCLPKTGGESGKFTRGSPLGCNRWTWAARRARRKPLPGTLAGAGAGGEPQRQAPAVVPDCARILVLVLWWGNGWGYGRRAGWLCWRARRANSREGRAAGDSRSVQSWRAPAGWFSRGIWDAPYAGNAPGGGELREPRGGECRESGLAAASFLEAPNRGTIAGRPLCRIIFC